MNHVFYVKQLRALAVVALLAGLVLIHTLSAPVSATSTMVWEIATVESGANDVGSNSSIDINPQTGLPAITYYNTQGYLKEAIYVGTDSTCMNRWQCFNLAGDGLSQMGTSSSMKFASNGHAWVAYSDPYYSGVGLMEVDSVGKVIADTFPLYPMAGVGPGNGGTDTFKFPSVTLASDGPHVAAWEKHHDYDLVGVDFKNPQQNGGWLAPSWADPNSTLGYYTQLDWNMQSNRPYIAYRGNGGAIPVNNTLNYEFAVSFLDNTCPDFKGDTQPWTCRVIDGSPNTGNMIAFHAPKSASDKLQVAYYDGNNHVLKYAKYVGGNSVCGIIPGEQGWQCEQIETIGTDSAMGVAMAIDPANSPVIAYTDHDDHATSVLKVARPVASGGNCGLGTSAGKWQCNQIDTGNNGFGQLHNVGGFPSIAISADGRTHISYYDTANHALKVAIEKNVQAITFQPLANKFTSDAPFTVSASASSKLPVTFSASGVCSVSGSSVTLSGQVGNCTITAHQAGDNLWHSAGDVSQTFAVSVHISFKSPQTISFAALPDRTVGGAPFTVSAAASSGLPVSFTASGMCSVNGATVTLSGQTGNCTVTAHQAGNATYNPAPDVAHSFAVNDPAKQNQAITFAALPDKTVGDAPFSVSATASSGLPVSFTASGVCSVNGVTVTLNGQPGDCTITAHQAGNAAYNAAADVARPFTVNLPPKQSQTISFGSLPDKLTNDPPFQISATASSGLPVNFTANGTCSINGTTVTLSGSSGNCTITAHQDGNATFDAAPDVVRSFAVNDPAKQPQTITFGPVADKTVGDAPFQITATSSSGLPVSFIAMGPCSVSNNVVTITDEGICSITAWQDGDATYNAAAHVSQTFHISANDPSHTPDNTHFIVYLPVVRR